MTCYFCQEPRDSYLSYFCEDCSKLKRTINLYGKRVHQVVDEVLIRKPDQQKLKINKELHKEEETIKKYNLRSKEISNKPILNAL
jgi:hypothetical protein